MYEDGYLDEDFYARRGDLYLHATHDIRALIKDPHVYKEATRIIIEAIDRAHGQ